MASPELLQHVNNSDPLEMQVFASVPEKDQQAWLTFYHAAQEREAIKVRPVYTFDQFNKGVAPHIGEFMPVLDDLVIKGIGGSALILNYQEEHAITKGDHEFVLDPMLTAFDCQRSLLERKLKKGPIALLMPHPSLATPYLTARALAETLGRERAANIYTVIGPRATVAEFEFYDKTAEKIINISPVLMGRAINNLVLTGPDTDSVRGNESLAEWLKNLRRNFLIQLKQIVEPKDDGNNNIIMFCPAGRIASDGKEFRVDGSFDYLTRYPQLSVWPVGVFDRVLQSSSQPQSGVYINPDKAMWNPQNEKHANYLHERATMLSQSPFGGLDFETAFAHNKRLIKQRLPTRSKGSLKPYLSE